MEKRIEDYLHLYLGCEAEVCTGESDLDGIGNLVQIDTNYGQKTAIVERDRFCSEVGVEFIKPILRPLSDIKEEERLERGAIITKYGKEFIDAEYHRWMLSKGFDLFGLIDSGLAIDKTKIK